MNSTIGYLPPRSIHSYFNLLLSELRHLPRDVLVQESQVPQSVEQATQTVSSSYTGAGNEWRSIQVHGGIYMLMLRRN